MSWESYLTGLAAERTVKNALFFERQTKDILASTDRWTITADEAIALLDCLGETESVTIAGEQYTKNNIQGDYKIRIRFPSTQKKGIWILKADPAVLVVQYENKMLRRVYDYDELQPALNNVPRAMGLPYVKWLKE